MATARTNQQIVAQNIFIASLSNYFQVINKAARQPDLNMAALRHGLKNFRKDSPNARVFTSYAITPKDLKVNTGNNCDEILSNDDENSFKNFIDKREDPDDATNSGTSTPVHYRKNRSQSSPPSGYEWCSTASTVTDSEDGQRTPQTSWQHQPIIKSSASQNKSEWQRGIMLSLKNIGKKLEGILQSKNKSQGKEYEMKSQSVIKEMKKGPASSIRKCLTSMSASLPSLAIDVTIPVPYKPKRTLHIVEHATKNVESIPFSELKHNKKVEALCLKRHDRLRLRKPICKLPSPRHLELIPCFTDDISFKSPKPKHKKYKNGLRNENMMTVISTFIQTKCNSNVDVLDLVNFIGNKKYYFRHLERGNKVRSYLNSIQKRNFQCSLKHIKSNGISFDNRQNAINDMNRDYDIIKHEGKMIEQIGKTHDDSLEELFNNKNHLLISFDEEPNSDAGTPESLNLFDAVIRNNRYFTRDNFSADDYVIALKQSFSDTRLNNTCLKRFSVKTEKRSASLSFVKVVDSKTTNVNSSTQYPCSSANKDMNLLPPYASLLGVKKLFSKPYEEIRKEYSTDNGFHPDFRIADKGIPNEVLHSVLMTYLKENSHSKVILTKEPSKKNIFKTNTVRQSASDCNLSSDAFKSNKCENTLDKRSAIDKSDKLNFSFNDNAENISVQGLVKSEINLKECFNIDIPSSIRRKKHADSSKQLTQIFLKHNDIFSSDVEKLLLDEKVIDDCKNHKLHDEENDELKGEKDECRMKTEMEGLRNKIKESDERLASFITYDENFYGKEKMEKVIKTLMKENDQKITDTCEKETEKQILPQISVENIILRVEGMIVKDKFEGEVRQVSMEKNSLVGEKDDIDKIQQDFIEESNLEESRQIKKPLTKINTISSECNVTSGDSNARQILERLKGEGNDVVENDRTTFGHKTETLKSTNDGSSMMNEIESVNSKGAIQNNGKYDVDGLSNEESAKCQVNDRSLVLIDKENGKFSQDSGEKDLKRPKSRNELQKINYKKNVTALFVKDFSNAEVRKSIFEEAMNDKNKISFNPNNINTYNLNDLVKINPLQSGKAFQKFGFEVVDLYLKDNEMKLSRQNTFQFQKNSSNHDSNPVGKVTMKKDMSLVSVKPELDIKPLDNLKIKIANNENEKLENGKSDNGYLDVSNKTLRNKSNKGVLDSSLNLNLKNNYEEPTAETYCNKKRENFNNSDDTDVTSVTCSSEVSGTETKRLTDKIYSEPATDNDYKAVEKNGKAEGNESALIEMKVETDADKKMANLCRLYNKYERDQKESVLFTDFEIKKESIADYYINNSFADKKKTNGNLRNQFSGFTTPSVHSFKMTKSSERENDLSANHMMYFNSKYLPPENEHGGTDEAPPGALKYNLYQRKRSPVSLSRNQNSGNTELKKTSVAKNVFGNDPFTRKNIFEKKPNEEMKNRSKKHEKNLEGKSDLQVKKSTDELLWERKVEEITTESIEEVKITESATQTAVEKILHNEIKTNNVPTNIESVMSVEKSSMNEVKKSEPESKILPQKEGNMTSLEKPSLRTEERPKAEARNVEDKAKHKAVSKELGNKNKTQERILLYGTENVEPELINQEKNSENVMSFEKLNNKSKLQEAESGNLEKKDNTRAQERGLSNQILKLESESKTNVAQKKNNERIMVQKSKQEVQKSQLEFQNNEENLTTKKNFLSCKIEKPQLEKNINWNNNKVTVEKRHDLSVTLDEPDLFPTTNPMKRPENLDEKENVKMKAQIGTSLNEKLLIEPYFPKRSKDNMNLSELLLEKKKVMETGINTGKVVNMENEMPTLKPSSDKEEGININNENGNTQSKLNTPISNALGDKKGSNFEKRLSNDYRGISNSLLRNKRSVEKFTRTELTQKKLVSYEDVKHSNDPEIEIKKIESLEDTIKSCKKKYEKLRLKTKEDSDEKNDGEEVSDSFDVSSKNQIKKVESDTELLLETEYLNKKKKEDLPSFLGSSQNSRELKEGLKSKENESNPSPSSQAVVEKLTKLLETGIRNVEIGKKSDQSSSSLWPIVNVRSPSSKNKKTVDTDGFKVQDHKNETKSEPRKVERNLEPNREKYMNEAKSRGYNDIDRNVSRNYSLDRKNKEIPLEDEDNRRLTNPSSVLFISKDQSDAKKSFNHSIKEPSRSFKTMLNPTLRPIYAKSTASKNVEYLKSRILKIEKENKNKSRRMQEKNISHYDFSARVSHPEQLYGNKVIPKLDYSAVKKVAEKDLEEKREDHLKAFNSYHSNIKQRISRQYNDADKKRQLYFRYNNSILESADNSIQSDALNTDSDRRPLNNEVGTEATGQGSIKLYTVKNEEYGTNSNLNQPGQVEKGVTINQESSVMQSLPNDWISKKPEKDVNVYDKMINNSAPSDINFSANKNAKSTYPAPNPAKNKDFIVSNMKTLEEESSMTTFITNLKDKTFKLFSSSSIMEHLTNKPTPLDSAETEPYSQPRSTFKVDRKATTTGNKGISELSKRNSKTDKKERMLSVKEHSDTTKSFADSHKDINKKNIENKYLAWSEDMKATENISSNKQHLGQKTKDSKISKKIKFENNSRPKSTPSKKESRTNESIRSDKIRSSAKKVESWVIKNNFEGINRHTNPMEPNKNESYLSNVEERPANRVYLSLTQTVGGGNKGSTEKFHHKSKISLTRDKNMYQGTNQDVRNNEYKQNRHGEVSNKKDNNVKKNYSSKAGPFKSKIPFATHGRKSFGRNNLTSNRGEMDSSYSNRIRDGSPKKETNYARLANRKTSFSGNNKKNYLNKITQKHMDYISLTDVAKNEPINKKGIIDYFSSHQIPENYAPKNRFKNSKSERNIAATSFALPMTRQVKVSPRGSVTKHRVNVHPISRRQKSKLHDLFGNNRGINNLRSSVQSFGNVKQSPKNVDSKIISTNSHVSRNVRGRTFLRSLKIKDDYDQKQREPFNSFLNSNNNGDDDNVNDVKRNLINYLKKDRMQTSVTEVRYKPPSMLNRNFNSQSSKTNRYSNQPSSSQIYSAQYERIGDKNKLFEDYVNSLIPVRKMREHINRRYLSTQRRFLMSIKDNCSFSESVSHKEYRAYETRTPSLHNYFPPGAKFSMD